MHSCDVLAALVRLTVCAADRSTSCNVTTYFMPNVCKPFVLKIFLCLESCRVRFVENRSVQRKLWDPPPKALCRLEMSWQTSISVGRLGSGRQ